MTTCLLLRPSVFYILLDSTYRGLFLFFFLFKDYHLDQAKPLFGPDSFSTAHDENMAFGLGGTSSSAGSSGGAVNADKIDGAIVEYVLQPRRVFILTTTNASTDWTWSPTCSTEWSRTSFLLSNR